MTAQGGSTARIQAAARAGSLSPRTFKRMLGTDGAPLRTSEYFGCATFSFDLVDSQQSHDEEGGAAQLAGKGMELMSALRDLCNDMEQAVDDERWSLPKYREMLYLQ